MMLSIMSGSLIRDTPPWARMSAGTRSSAITATAPASSAILACSAVTTSMITPPLSISAMPRLTRAVPTSGATSAAVTGVLVELPSAMFPSYGGPGVRRDSGGEIRAGMIRDRAIRPSVQADSCAWACRRTTQIRWATVTVLANASAHRAM